MGHLSIKRMTNQDEGFYCLMGSSLSRRAIVKELGLSVWDDDGKIWFLALAHNNTVAGFGAVIVKGNKASLNSGYVYPEYRNRGIYSELLVSRLSYLRDVGVTRILTTATNASKSTLEKHGFVVVKKYVKYQDMELLYAK